MWLPVSDQLQPWLICDHFVFFWRYSGLKAENHQFVPTPLSFSALIWGEPFWTSWITYTFVTIFLEIQWLNLCLPHSHLMPLYGVNPFELRELWWTWSRPVSRQRQLIPSAKPSPAETVVSRGWTYLFYIVPVAYSFLSSCTMEFFV